MADDSRRLVHAHDLDAENMTIAELQAEVLLTAYARSLKVGTTVIGITTVTVTTIVTNVADVGIGVGMVDVLIMGIESMRSMTTSPNRIRKAMDRLWSSEGRRVSRRGTTK